MGDVRHEETSIAKEVSVLSLPEDLFAPEATQHVVAADKWTGEIIEPATFRDDDAFAVVQLHRGPTGPEFTQRSLEAMVMAWTHDVEVTFRDSERWSREQASIAVNTFRIDAWHAECLGFREAGPMLTGAAEGGQRGTLFGIYCEDGSQPLRLDDAVTLLGSIKLRDPGPPPLKPEPLTARQSDCQLCEGGA